MPGLLRRVQQPVVECLVAEGNAAELFPAIHIPSADAHADLLGLCVFMVVLTHSEQHSWRSCEKKERLIRLEHWGKQAKKLNSNPLYSIQNGVRSRGTSNKGHGQRDKEVTFVGAQLIFKMNIGHGSLLSEAEPQQAETRETTTMTLYDEQTTMRGKTWVENN